MKPQNFVDWLVERGWCCILNCPLYCRWGAAITCIYIKSGEVLHSSEWAWNCFGWNHEGICSLLWQVCTLCLCTCWISYYYLHWWLHTLVSQEVMMKSEVFICVIPWYKWEHDSKTTTWVACTSIWNACCAFLTGSINGITLFHSWNDRLLYHCVRPRVLSIIEPAKKMHTGNVLSPISLVPLLKLFGPGRLCMSSNFSILFWQPKP